MVVFDQQALLALELNLEKEAFCLFCPGKGVPESINVRDRRLRAWLGCSLMTAAKAWNLLDHGGALKPGATKNKFLWALRFLKCHETESVAAAACGRINEGCGGGFACGTKTSTAG